MTKTIKDCFREFEDKVAGIEGNKGLWPGVNLRYHICKSFSLIKRFIQTQPLENQRDLWVTIINLLNDSKAFNNEEKEEIRGELLESVSIELEDLNKYMIRLQLHTQKTTTVKGNAKKANKPDAKFNWQGTQAQLVYLIEQLYEQGFLSPISQPEKHRLTAQHFTVKGESLNTKTLAQIKQNSLNRRGGKPKKGEKIEQIISAAKKQKD